MSDLINDQYDFFKAVQLDAEGNLLVSIVNFTGGTSGGTISGNYLPLSGGTVNGETSFTNGLYTNSLTATTINEVDYIDFNSSYTGNSNHVLGRLNWNIDDGTLEIGMGSDEVTQQVGLEQYYLIKNQTGSQLQNGKVIRASGTLGNSGRITGDYMIADGTIPYYFTIGIATQDINDGEDGYVTNFGLVRGIDTTGTPYGEVWADGDILYVSTTISGGLTKNEPTEPNLKIQMAIVINADANGSIFVRPSLGYRLEDLHDLQTTGATHGDLISFNSGNSIWEYTKTLNGDFLVSGKLEIDGDLDVSGLTSNYIIGGDANGFDYIIDGGDANYPIFTDYDDLFPAISTGQTTYYFSEPVNVLSIGILTGNTAVVLPTFPTNRQYVVKDKTGNAGLFPITVSSIGNTINGETNFIINTNTKPSITFLWDGQEYITI